MDILILVTLGTQKQSFERLLKYIDDSKIKDEIVVQAGYTKYEFKKKNIKVFDFINYEEMDKLIDKADIIITHGGTGSIVEPLKRNKKIIACARLEKYGEHVDNHQQELVSIFSDEGYILKLDEDNSLDKIIKEIKNFEPQKYKSNTDNFKKRLIDEINKKREKFNLTNVLKTIINLFLMLFLFLTLYSILDNNYGLSNLLIIPIIIFFIVIVSYITKLLLKLNNKWLIFVLIAICFIIRIVWVLGVNVEPRVDYFTFNNTATKLANNTLLADTSLTRFVATFPHIFGYSNFLSFFYKIFGSNVFVAQILNIILSCFSLYFIYKICYKTLNKKYAIISSILWIIYPAQIIFNSFVCSEQIGRASCRERV